MLYVSTRDRTDSFTAHRTLCEDKSKSGGLFVPMRVPQFSKGEISILGEKTFGETVAQILNMFFPAGLTGWDVDFSVGRLPYRIVPMNHKLYIAELWHNHSLDYRFLEQSLYRKVSNFSRNPTEWFHMAIRIAILFGICGDLQRKDIRHFDVSVASGDFSDVMAAWYAKQMGLPIETIIVCCNDNSSIWDLICRGEMPTGTSVIHTDLPKLDRVCPESLERLLYECLGRDEVTRYLAVCDKGGTFHVNEEIHDQLCQGLDAASVRNDRCIPLIRSIYRTYNYIADPYVATAFAGIQDHRSRTGEIRPTVLLSDTTPMIYADLILQSTGLTEMELKKKLNYA